MDMDKSAKQLLEGKVNELESAQARYIELFQYNISKINHLKSVCRDLVAKNSQASTRIKQIIEKLKSELI